MRPFNNWSLRSKLILLAVLPSLTLALAFALLVMSLNTLSATRAFVGAESLWAKGQKDAVYDLRKFTGDRSQDDFQAYQQAIAVPLGDQLARQQLESATPNLNLAKQGFEQAGNDPADISGMITLFRYLHNLSYFARPIAVWRQSDVGLAELQDYAAALHAEVIGPNDRAKEIAYLTQLDQISAQLDSSEREFSSQMGEAARWLAASLILIGGLVFLAVAVLTVYLAYFVIRRMAVDLSRLQDIAVAAESGDYSQRIKPLSSDEVGALAESINGMMETVATSKKSLEVGLKQSEIDRRQLEDTKKAVLNILEDLRDEKAVAEEARLRDEALLRSIGEGLIVTDESGKVSYINDYACEILGYKQREVIGQWFPRAVVAVDSRNQPLKEIERPILQALTGGHPVSTQLHYRRNDGSIVPVFLTVSPVVVEDHPVGAIQIFRDITREMELEKAKDEFVSLASHQLRTPATGVKAFASMLHDGYAGKLSAKQEEFVQKIFDSNERQLRIINDMLNVARVDSGRLVLMPTMTDVVALIKASIEESDPVIKGRKQSIKLEAPEKLELNVDSDRLRMVFDNLIDNASKYTPEKGSIAVKLVTTQKNAIVEVSDSGVGIAKRDIAKLFSKFSRIDNPLSAKVGGSGLGLYLVGSIVKLHNGRMEVDSQLGKGSTFRVVLPKSSKVVKRSDIVRSERATIT